MISVFFPIDLFEDLIIFNASFCYIINAYLLFSLITKHAMGNTVIDFLCYRILLPQEIPLQYGGICEVILVRV